MYELRELVRKDFIQINQWRNNPQIISCLGAPFRFINREVEEQWFEHYMSNCGTAIRCSIIETEKEEEVLGLVSLTSIDFIHRSAEFHIMIGEEKNFGRGIGTAATNALLQHAFDNLNLHRVELSVLETNKRAIQLYKKIGFMQEGIKREAVYKGGGYINLIIMSILDSNFRGENSTIKNSIPIYCCIQPLSLLETVDAYNSIEYAFSPPLSEKIPNFLTYIRKTYLGATIYIARSDEMMGMIVFYCNDSKSNVSYITHLAVVPKYQNQNIGKKLIELCIEISSIRRMNLIQLEVQNDNKRAINFYTKMGFEYIKDASETSIYMAQRI